MENIGDPRAEILLRVIFFVFEVARVRILSQQIITKLFAPVDVQFLIGFGKMPLDRVMRYIQMLCDVLDAPSTEKQHRHVICFSLLKVLEHIGKRTV